MKTKIELKHLEDLIDSAETQEHVFFNKALVIEYKLKSGFTIQGRAACVDPTNFDVEIGRKVCRKNAVDELWQLEGYVLQLTLNGDIADQRN